MNAIKKKITWYKYANINKVIRKNPNNEEYAFWKNSSLYIEGETDAGKRACVPVCLTALKERAPRQHRFILCYSISSVLKSNSHRVSDRKDGRSGPKAGTELSPHPPPTRGLRRCLLKNLHRRRRGVNTQNEGNSVFLQHINNHRCMHAHTRSTTCTQAPTSSNRQKASNHCFF